MKIKFTLTFLFGLFFCLNIQAQWSTKSFNWDGLTREYKIYTSSNLNSSKPSPIVVALHGMGDDMGNFSQTIAAEFTQIADTTNAIILVPNAEIFTLLNMRAWNSGAAMAGIAPNQDVDDIGFINQMVDNVIAGYNVDENRIFMCGFSMGGFMTERMADQSNSRYAAFASVAGTFGDEMDVINPGRSVKIAHFHGTEDATVSYSGNSFGWDVDDLIDFWKDNNNCDVEPDIQYTFQDSADDGKTIEHFIYKGDEDVHLFKVYGADHEWLFQNQNDISYDVQMWIFFNDYETELGVKNYSKDFDISVYPNPTQDVLNIKLPQNAINQPYQINLYDMQGRLVYHQQSQDDTFGFSLMNNNLEQGTYLLRVYNSDFNISKTIILD